MSHDLGEDDRTDVDVQDATIYFTDTVKDLDLSTTDQIVITSAGGRLILHRFGFTYDGHDGAMHDLSASAGQFANHELRLEVDQLRNCLELIACRGRGRSYHHVLGELDSGMRQSPAFRSNIMNANARLTAWHRRRSSR